MNLPKIDVSALPDLDVLTGVFGSLKNASAVVTDDMLVVLMTYIYDVVDPTGLA